SLISPARKGTVRRFGDTSHLPVVIPSFCSEVIQQVHSSNTHQEKQQCALVWPEMLDIGRKAHHDPMLKLPTSRKRNPHHEDLLTRTEATQPARAVGLVGNLLEAALITQGVLSDMILKKDKSEYRYYIDKLGYLNKKCPGPERTQDPSEPSAAAPQGADSEWP
ncbi:hypothetical protein U0070_022864, partial [Myodes glareolus]